jgi:DNA-binding MarR family transcriptional regulator
MTAENLMGDLVSSPTLQLAMTGRAATRRLTDALASVGLKPRQFHALALLHERGPMSQQALAEALEIDPSVLVGLLNPLEADGLASRERDASDRRRHIVAMTQTGTARLRDGRRACEAGERQLLAALDDDERQQFVRLLARIQPAAHLGSGGSCDSEISEEC